MDRDNVNSQDKVTGPTTTNPTSRHILVHPSIEKGDDNNDNGTRLQDCNFHDVEGVDAECTLLVEETRLSSSSDSTEVIAQSQQPSRGANLDSLPDEILFEILQYLDVPELHALIKTTHHLRNVSLDPVLHRNRLRSARIALAHSLKNRPSLYTLKYERRVYLSGGDLARRQLNRSLNKIRLKKKLSNRPDPALLVRKGVLPLRYLKKQSKEKSTPTVVQPPIPKVSPSVRKSAEADSNSSFSIACSYNTPARLTYRHQEQQQQHHHHYHEIHTYSYTYTFPPRISPFLLSTCQSLEKQLLKSHLQLWHQSKRPSLKQAIEKGLISQDMLMPSWAADSGDYVSTSKQSLSTFTTANTLARRFPRPTVRYLITRFTERMDYDEFRKKQIWEGRWGRNRVKRVVGEGSSSVWWNRNGPSSGNCGWSVERDLNPPRAKVLGLRRMYERLSRGGQS